jgi:sugar phosphate isomerase/epimerase
MRDLTRRDVLRIGAGVAGMALLPLGQGDAAYGGFKMGVQTYSLRAFDFEQTLAHLKDFGLRYAQFFGGKQMQVVDDKAKIDGWKEKLKAAGVSILSFGVERFDKNADSTKKRFEFAKAMGFSVYTASPTPDSFESLAALTKEYGIRIAIHNHGPEDKTYGKLEQIQKAIDKWPEAIGVCVDTGHVLRIGEDPVQWIQALGPRVHDVHFKDFSDARTEHILGQGKLDVLGSLKALKDAKFSGLLALEYEKNEKNPIDDMKACLAAVREAAKKL